MTSSGSPLTPEAVPRIKSTLTRESRYRGALLGLAVGDALGGAVEFKRPGSFPRVTEMLGGGPHHLTPGEWTDDTSMALCLAESLIEKQGFDARDQMERYVRWREEGHLSSKGTCFDIGLTVGGALTSFQRTGEPFSGPKAENTAGNGSLMRLAPVVMWFANDPKAAVEMAAESSRTTHGAAQAIDACRYFAGLMAGALNGASKRDILTPLYTPYPGAWTASPLNAVIARIAEGSYKERTAEQLPASGYVAHTLEAALWAFATTDNFEQGVLRAVNLGNDADTTGAVYGQLAGAFYGVEAIPSRWRDLIVMRELIESYAQKLMPAAFRRGGSEAPSRSSRSRRGDAI